MSEFAISSPAFTHMSTIPRKYTCQGEDIIPPLQFQNIPEGTASFVLIMDDPDAPMGTWDHWILWNIDPQTTEISEGTTPAGAVVGKNSWGKNSYGGPCPPFGQHRYFFKLYALNTKLELSSDVTKKQLEKAMKGKIIAAAELVGVYQKS
ncbi:YbhB/YbcL family Raf kinase inhibitor-like protein [Candidatus Heimdallarchaeota archaeon]|nr:MAG: YbhB/YbcL family Raf kinase inhibitor-like protein [Candidatus Gerdarchaeota archaeon]RLI70681.1 MAG: YbhB/YbcL family Raf kinase inhibitor-like protein [Candidatus Heimdallarchaeota archaeon]